MAVQQPSSTTRSSRKPLLDGHRVTTARCSSRRVPQSEPEFNHGSSLLSSSSPERQWCFPHHQDPPHLALITTRDSCDSDAHTERALRQLRRATMSDCGGGGVDLVSVRVNVPATASDPAVEARVTRLVQQLVAWSQPSNAFRVVVSSDWWNVGLRAGAHGVHFKESHRHFIPQARAWFREWHNNNNNTIMLVGTSTHTVASALDAMERYQPDYFFCGTCFETESHPEKSGDDLEGPALPAQVAQALKRHWQQHHDRSNDWEAPALLPKVLAIGGLNASNCREQLTRGFYEDDARADGIATIRAVLEADRPDDAVREICANMRRGMTEL